jgi:hypothetical protein
MKTERLYRTQINENLSVSTIRSRDGNVVRFETALIWNGSVSDSIFSQNRSFAGDTHDRVCDWARGARDAHSRLHASLESMLKDAKGDY